ncbi:MAG: DUF1553 domain-containing protein [Pedosphaera sp.]|nr:DUF1553 domain-containing protein [Pedosphaera sp.]
MRSECIGILFGAGPTEDTASNAVLREGIASLPAAHVRRFRVWLLTLLATLAAPLLAEDFTFFEQKIRPILTEHCYRCHSAQAEKLKSGLRLDTREGILRGGESGQPAFIPGEPEKSRLIEAIRYTNHDFRMPPKEQLTARQVADFVTWIQLGAPDPRSESIAQGRVHIPGTEHWAFQPVHRPAVPKVTRTNRVQTPLDAFILAALEAKKLSLAPPADRRTLIRRAYYDLIGLPPTPKDVEAFIEDSAPNAFAKVVDRLLAAPAYGERWGRHWLDVVRYADARDLIQLPVESDFREAWRYRDWVVESHNRDLPYTEFIRRQIAGDLLQPSDPEQLDTDSLVATGLLAIADFVPGDVDKDQMIADYVNDQIDVVGRAFLGLTLGCARCHDHKFDPISIQDYYGLAGIFFSTRLIPSPVLGNTPLVRVPLVPKAELERIAARKKRLLELGEQIRKLTLDAELEYLSHLERLTTEQTARYLLATWKFHHPATPEAKLDLIDFAKTNALHPKMLARWLDYFGLREYSPCGSLSRNVDEVLGLHRWRRGTNSIPAIHVNARDESLAHKGETFPARSLSLTPSKTSGIVLGWTSPFSGTVRLTGRVSDRKTTGTKGFSSALDLRTPAGRMELAMFQVASGGAVDLATSPDRARLAEVIVHAGDRLEWIVLPQADSTPTAEIEWTLAEVGSERVWSTRKDLAREPESDPAGAALADGHGNLGVWHFQETGDIRRATGEPAMGNQAWAAWKRTLAEADHQPADPTRAERAAHELEDALIAIRQKEAEANGAAAARALASGEPGPLRSEILRLQAPDSRLLTSSEGRVTIWPNRARSTLKFATAEPPSSGPLRTNVVLGGRRRTVLSFAGTESLEVPQTAPPAGSLFLVFRRADIAAAGQRILGWEDASAGRHGLGLMLTPGGGLHVILRKDGANGDIVAPPATNQDFEIVSLIWGSGGATLFRQGVAAGKSSGFDGISSDPEIKALKLGGPGSGAGEKFRGVLAEVRVYTQPLDDTSRVKVEKELSEAWLNPGATEPPPADALTLVYEELCSPRGPFWLGDTERNGMFESTQTPRLTEIHTEMGALKSAIPTNLPQAVVVQDGGPASTKHEGFKDAHIYLRGNPAKPGPIVPRGFPKVLVGDQPVAITNGSGRLPLANWIASADNPLTARVAVNRIWQHHFGQGIVRTSTNFGRRGERPTHPELLDYLASCFMESGWSIKSIHRLIMLSAAYQQRSAADPEILAADPENLLLGRMNRQSLDAESFRDSLLSVAGRLDLRPGGVGFQEIGLPRRSLYLMSVRTGAKSGFASVFDGPDSSAIVEKRTVSTVAPQALFLLNDPFTIDQARELARRIAHDFSASTPDEQVRAAYRLLFGRSPTGVEISVGQTLLEGPGQADLLARYCQLLLGSNEFFYVD